MVNRYVYIGYTWYILWNCILYSSYSILLNKNMSAPEKFNISKFLKQFNDLSWK